MFFKRTIEKVRTRTKNKKKKCYYCSFFQILRKETAAWRNGQRVRLRIQRLWVRVPSWSSQGHPIEKKTRVFKTRVFYNDFWLVDFEKPSPYRKKTRVFLYNENILFFNIRGGVEITHTFGRPMGNLQMVEMNESKGIARQFRSLSKLQVVEPRIIISKKLLKLQFSRRLLSHHMLFFHKLTSDH